MRDGGRSLLAWLVALATTAVGGACGSDAFRCDKGSDCQGAGAEAFCEATGHCSVADPTCESGRRYAEHAGDLAGTCVPSGVAGTDGDTSTTSASASATATMTDSSTATLTSTETSLTSLDTSGAVEATAGPESSTTPADSSSTLASDTNIGTSTDEGSTEPVGNGGEQCSACLIDAHQGPCMMQLNDCAGDAMCLSLAQCVAKCIQADEPECTVECCAIHPEDAVYEDLVMCDLEVCADVCTAFAVGCGGG